MNILVSPGWGPGTKVSFKGAIKQFTYSLSEVKHRIHYNEKLVKISHPARRVTATNVSRIPIFCQEGRNISILDIHWNLFLFDWAETMRWAETGERGPWLGRCESHLSNPEYRLRSPTLITEMRPVMIWILRYLQPWLLHTMMSGPSLCITLLRVDFHFTMEWSPLLNRILSGAMLYPIQSSRHPRWSKKVCQFYNLRIKLVPDLWADNKLIILSQDLPSCQTQNSLILCHY